MRYWPGWAWLKERIDSGEFGAVRSAFFQRLGSRPGWGGGFYDDPRRCGGALFDLHIHDADFVWWCFGMPGAVSTRGTLDHACTFYRYENLPGSRQNPGLVVAEGGWMGQPGWKFRMRYLVAFDEALADFDIGREPALLVCRGESSHAVELPPGAGYRYQARAVVSALTGAGGCAVPMEDAVRVTGLVEAERRSLESGREVEIKPQSAS
jgi:predicted dehydrogenase